MESVLALNVGEVLVGVVVQVHQTTEKEAGERKKRASSRAELQRVE